MKLFINIIFFFFSGLFFFSCTDNSDEIAELEDKVNKHNSNMTSISDESNRANSIKDEIFTELCDEKKNRLFNKDKK